MALERPNAEIAAAIQSGPVDSAVSETAIEMFGKSYLAGGLTPEQVRAILALGRFRRYAAQEFLMRAGQPGNDLVVVLAGRAVIVSPEGETLGEAQPGMVVGEVSLCDAGPRTADVIAKGLMDVVVLPAGPLRSHLATDRQAGFMVLANLAKTLANRLRTTNQKLDLLAEKGAGSWDRAL